MTGAIIQSEIRPMAVVIGFFYGVEKCSRLVENSFWGIRNEKEKM